MRIIIDTDPGNGIPGADIDDGFAIAMALRSPEIEVDAITVVAGNVPVDRGVECVLELIDLAGRPDVPVHRGAERPLTQDPSWWRARLDLRRDERLAQELWRDVQPRGSVLEAQRTEAAEALVERVNARPGEITVVAIGPLTNIAAAMQLDPDWASKIAGLVVMGGAFDLPNILHELNVAYDPEAADIVLRSHAPLRLVPLDVTLRTSLRLDDVDALESSGTALGAYLAATVRPWVIWHAERFGRDGCPLHDPLALATLVDPGLVSVRSAAVGVELSGVLTRGRTVAWDPTDDELLHAGLDLPEVRPVSIATDVDNDRFVKMLLESLCA